jgi:N-formylglutamate deformylase
MMLERERTAGNSPQDAASVVLHIPHASTVIPPSVRTGLLISGIELEAELLRLTDHYTDELFSGTVPGSSEVVFPVSRLVVDPERFVDDALELSALHGMGVIYTHGSRGQRVRNSPTPEERETLLDRFYRPHHRKLDDIVNTHLQRTGGCLLIDCHSFPLERLPIERPDARPDICIGTDSVHTPPHLRDAAVAAFVAEGYSVMVNAPFAGAMVSASHYGKDRRVSALMIELGRWLYMDEERGARHEGFERLRRVLGRCLVQIAAVATRATPGDSAPH